MKILLVAVGSGLGGVLRYLVPCWIGTAKGLPWATLTKVVTNRVVLTKEQAEKLLKTKRNLKVRKVKAEQ